MKILKTFLDSLMGPDTRKRYTYTSEGPLGSFYKDATAALRAAGVELKSSGFGGYTLPGEDGELQLVRGMTVVCKGHWEHTFNERMFICDDSLYSEREMRERVDGIPC
jgi:hypothetical protein